MLLYLSLSSIAFGEPPVQVFILAGQSNMQGHAQVRTFEHIGLDPKSKPLLEMMTNPDGSPKVCGRVWISSIGCADAEQIGKLTAGYGASNNGPKIGPEFTFGLTVEKYLSGKILLIKTSWGGKSLNTDFRSPSAGPYEFNANQLAQFEKQGKDVAAMKAEKQKATGVNYKLMIDHVKAVTSDIKRVIPDYDPVVGYQLAGFVWFQGWNDMVDSSTYPNRDKPGGYDAYSHAMSHFIRDVRKDLNSPELPFVIGVLGVGGPTDRYNEDEQRYKSTHDNFRNAMAAPASLPEFQGNVTALRTEKYWDLELSGARKKQEKIKAEAKKKAKEEKLNAQEEKLLTERMLAEQLTERERLVIETGISNMEFHYLGSAKILGGIGQGLAEEMLKLNRVPLN
ncbi:MAG: sialate O-acetylesterase [Pirellulales bacterium]